ncbi:protein TASOR 2 [Candoia aspera]|uniref:protein TASOR 2 n=1 Tax=Candoia aspera TaxID=51853 RepID=UPI002FD848F0
MLPLSCKNLAEHEMKVLYRAWEGQLFIQNQRVCDIVLRSPFQASIPAELPAKLEIKYVVGISELREKLPEAAFKKANYVNDEVCCQKLWFHLYEVEILHESELKDQLIGSMKEKNLALVKHLNDCGILLFLTSSVLVKEKDSDPNNLASLQALFLFPSPGPKHLTARDWKCEEERNEAPQQVPLVLPFLRHALAEAAKRPDPKPAASSALIKLHMQEFAKQSSTPSSENADSPAFASKPLSESPEWDSSNEKCSPASFLDLQFYLSDPQSYTLEVSLAVTCLKGSSQFPGGRAAEADLNSDPLPSGGPDQAIGTATAPLARHTPGRDAALNSSPGGDRPSQWSKRKSSRILGSSTKKKWSPLKVHCIMESSKKKEKEKKKKKKKKKKKSPKQMMDLSIPFAKDPRSPADSKEPTLKLKNLQNPLRRKRGAEVLSAEFIQGTRSELPEGATGSSGGLTTEEKKPRLKEAEKMKSEDKMDARRPTTRKGVHGASSERQRGDPVPVPKDTAAAEALRLPSREDCDSHALNLLADLALSSCNSPLDGNSRRDSGRFRPSREHRLLRGKFLHKSSDHEYHRATRKWKGAFLPGQASRPSLWPAREMGRDRDWPLNAKERGAVSSSRKRKARPSVAKSPLALLDETGDLSDSSVLISLEHSYASPVSETVKKGMPRSPNPRNGVKQDKPGPLVGKVLPFQYQQDLCPLGKQVMNHLPPARSSVMATRLREDFSASHQVTSCDKTVQVTFQWEAKYLFNLDSKYTNNSLEKTVLRAVHGPWDESLSDNMEEMGLILHMWVALFYSKQFQALTVRKVVEHSNPAKYVSLNSLVDPLEPIDDGGGPYVLEKRPVDSLSEADQVSGEGGEDGPVSPSEKPLSCNKLTSTNCLEDEGPLIKLEETKDLLCKEEPSHPPLKSFVKVVGEEPREQSLPHPAPPAENLPGVDERVSPQTCKTKAERSQGAKLAEASQSDAGPSECSRRQQPIASTEVAVSVESWGIDTPSSSEEVKEDNVPAGGPKRCTSEAVWLEADVKSREADSPGRKVQDLYGLRTDEEDGESMDWGSIDLALSESNDADTDAQDVDLDPENEEYPEKSCVKEKKETDSVCDVASPSRGPLPSRTSPDALSMPQTEFLGAQEGAIGPSSISVAPNQMGLIDTVPQQASPLHQGTFDEKIAESAKNIDPVSPKQMDEVENSHISQEDKAILADSASVQVAGEFPNDLATQDESLESQESLESVKSSRIPNQIHVVDISSVSQEDNGIHLACPASWQASPVHQRAPDEVVELPRGQEDHLENPLYRIFQNRMDLIEDISQDSTELADSAVHLCEPNSKPCVNSAPNSISTQQEFVENQDSSVGSTQRLALAKEMDLVQRLCAPEEEEEGNHLASLVHLQTSSPHQETSDDTAKLQEDHSARMDLVEDSSFSQEKEVINPMDKVLLQVNERQPVPLNFGTQEEQKARQREELQVDSQHAEEYLSVELHNVESETYSKNETSLVQENIRDSSASQEIASDDGVEKLTVTMVAIAEDVNTLINELVDAVCAMTVQREEMSAEKKTGLDWISSVTLECVTPPESDDEGCPTDQLSHVDLKWADECLERSSIFDDQEKDLQARVKGQGEFCSSPNENVTSDLVDVSEKTGLQGNDTTSTATEVFSSCGTSQAKLGTTNQECRCSLLETTESLEVDDYNVSILGKVEQTKTSPEEPICDREDCSGVVDVGNSPFVSAQSQTDSLAEESDSLVNGDTRQAPDDCEEVTQVEAKEHLGNLEDPLPGERTQFPTSSSGMDMDWEGESLMAGSGQDPCADWYPRSKLESLYHPRFEASPSITESEFICGSGPGNETCKDGDWASLENSPKVLDAKSEAVKYDFPFGLKKEDWSVLLSLDLDHKPKPFKDYINFSITKRHKEKNRTFHSFSKQHSPFTRDLGLINAWSRSWGLLNDPVQNILDMECLRFHCRVKEILKKSQRSTSRVLSTKKTPPQAIAEVLLLRKVSEVSAASSSPRSRSPLLVTIVNPNPRTSGRCDEFLDPLPAVWDRFCSAAALKSQVGPGPRDPFHLPKLTHSKLNNFPGDLPGIANEFAKLSRVMASESMRACNRERDPTATSEVVGEKGGPALPPRAISYDHLFTELHNTLHFRLKSMAQEACRKPYSFYLLETDDDPFFGRMKNLLKKGGHPEVDLLQFCKGGDMEMDNLVVIVRNEDIFPHIHEVPSLLRLKHFPNVTFAGVDSPEDTLDHTYQELFHSGGFVVSDDKVLEAMTVGELKDVIKTLEKLNSYGRWKWLLHYRETKNLREDARGDPAAHTKESVLRSCQGANITEVLHYHKCDSRSCPRFERFSCLLNLQIQHITKRFAVFLTENASASREALENRGILGLDVGGFLATAQEMVVPFGRGFW